MTTMGKIQGPGSLLRIWSDLNKNQNAAWSHYQAPSHHISAVYLTRFTPSNDQKFPPPSMGLSGRESLVESGRKSFNQKIFFVCEPIWTKIRRHVAAFKPQLSIFQLSPLFGSAASDDWKFPPPLTDLFREKHYNHGGVWSPKSPLLVGISASILVTELDSHSCMQRPKKMGPKYS